MHLSDAAIRELNTLMWNSEEAGRWSECMMNINMVLLGKPSGDWRLIGIPSVVYRLWVKLRGTISVAWFGSIERPYFACGRGRAAPAAFLRSP